MTALDPRVAEQVTASLAMARRLGYVQDDTIGRYVAGALYAAGLLAPPVESRTVEYGRQYPGASDADVCVNERAARAVSERDGCVPVIRTVTPWVRLPGAPS